MVPSGLTTAYSRGASGRASGARDGVTDFSLGTGGGVSGKSGGGGVDATGFVMLAGSPLVFSLLKMCIAKVSGNSFGGSSVETF